MALTEYLQRGWQIARRSPLLAIGGVNAAMMILSVVMSLVTVRILAKAEYGQLVYFYALFAPLRLFINFGLGFTISRDIASAGQDRERLRVIGSSMVFVRIVGTLAVSLLFIALSAFTDQPYLGFILAAAVASSLADLVFAMIAGLRMVGAVGAMTAAQPVSYALFVLALAVSGQANATLLMSAYVLSFVVMLLLGLLILSRAGMIGVLSLSGLDWGYTRGALLFAVPVYASSLISQGWVSVTSGWLGWHQQFQQAAEFGVVFNLVNLIVSISSPTLITTFYPHLSYLHQQPGGTAQALRYIRSTLTLVLYGYVFVAVAFFSFPHTAVALLFGDEYISSAAYLTILAPAIIAIGATPVFSFSLLATGRAWRLLIAQGLQLIILVGILLALPYQVRSLDLAWAALLSSMIGLIVQAAMLGYTLKESVIPAGWWQILLVGIGAALLLRVLASNIGIALSIWHFIAGGAFALIYWLRVLKLEGVSWGIKSS